MKKDMNIKKDIQILCAPRNQSLLLMLYSHTSKNKTQATDASPYTLNKQLKFLIIFIYCWGVGTCHYTNVKGRG